MLIPLIISALAAACSSTQQNAAAPAPDAAKRQQATVVARTGGPGQVQVKVVRDGKTVDLTGDEVIEIDGMELDDLDIDAIVNDADIQARIAEAMANVRGAMPQVRAGLAAARMPGIEWAAAADANAEVEMEKDAAFLGIGTEPVSPQTAAQLPLVRGTGLVVTMVEKDSPAEKAGLAPYDVIARIGDQMVINAEQFAVLVRSRKPGDAVEVTYLRGGKEQKATVTLVGKELPKLGPGGRRMGSALFEPMPLGATEQDVLFAAAGGPATGPRPRVMAFKDADGKDDRFNVRVNRAQRGARAGASNGASVTQVRRIAYTDDQASIEWTQGGDEPAFRITDLKDGPDWEGTTKPDADALAKLRPAVAEAVRRFIDYEAKLRDAIPAVPVPPVPPVPPIAPAAPVAPVPPSVTAAGD